MIQDFLDGNVFCVDFERDVAAMRSDVDFWNSYDFQLLFQIIQMPDSRYYEKHREELLAKGRAYKQANKEKLKKQVKQRRIARRTAWADRLEKLKGQELREDIIRQLALLVEEARDVGQFGPAVQAAKVLLDETKRDEPEKPRLAPDIPAWLNEDDEDHPAN